MRLDESDGGLPPAAVAAPVAQSMNFKVIDYSNNN